jgi:hypothetical protein
MDNRMTALMHEVERDLDAWQSVHPRATFAEMEIAVEERITQLRARMLEQRVAAAAAVAWPAESAAALARPNVNRTGTVTHSLKRLVAETPRVIMSTQYCGGYAVGSCSSGCVAPVFSFRLRGTCRRSVRSLGVRGWKLSPHMAGRPC